MQETDFKTKIDELVDVHLKDWLKTKCLALYKSKGVDVSQFENDFRLPKVVLTAALKEAAFQFTPIHPSDKREVKNLENF